MARIIESETSVRRMIKLSANDIISVVREYQRIIEGRFNIENIRDLLEDNVIYIPEDI